jgi:hypothetical protein
MFDSETPHGQTLSLRLTFFGDSYLPSEDQILTTLTWEPRYDQQRLPEAISHRLEANDCACK